MRIIFYLFFLFIHIISFGQNLVSNSSFEIYSTCPTSQSGISGGNLVPNWGVPPGSIITPDYFNSCYSGSSNDCIYVDVPQNFGGNCLARTGDAYAGILAYYTLGTINTKEYLYQKLTSPLVSGQCYEIEFWVQIADHSGFSVDKIGAVISKTPLEQEFNLQISVVPTINSNEQVDDSVNWVRIHDDYFAEGGEQYITIGNFYHDTLSNVLPFSDFNFGCDLVEGGAYYYIDDVSIQQCKGVYCRNDTICEGDSITLYAFGSNIHSWVEESNPDTILSNSYSLTVSPEMNTNYLIYGDFDTALVTLVVKEFPEVRLIDDTTICPGSILNLIPQLENTIEFWWQDGSSDSPYFIGEKGIYILTASNDCGNISDSVIITVDSLNLFDLSDTLICNIEPYLVSFNFPNVEYIWSNGETESFLEIQDEGEFWVQISNECGIYIDTFRIELLNCNNVKEMPNVFSPNNDGLNELFEPIQIDNMEIQKFVILNRWGQTVYYSTDSNFGWNGKFLNRDCSEGTYFWNVIYKMIDGEEYSMNGFVQLVK